MQAASRSANARGSFLRSGWTFGGRLPEPSHDDLVGPIDLLVDLPARPHQTVDVLLVFPDVGVLADHRLALPRTPGTELARRERASDLRPERGATLRVDSRGPTLQAFVDRRARRCRGIRPALRARWPGARPREKEGASAQLPRSP